MHNRPIFAYTNNTMIQKARQVSTDIGPVEAALQSGDLAGARAALQRLLAPRPDDILLLTYLALVERRSGDVQGARARLTGLLRRAPDYFPALIELARTESGAENLTAAAQFYERANRANPTTSDGLAEWAEVLRALGRYEDMEKVAAARCNFADAKGEDWFVLGLSRQLRGKHSEARDAYQRAHAHNPNHAMTVNNLAVIAIQDEDYDRATDYLKAALAIDQNLKMAWTNLSRVRLAQFDLAGALAAAEHAYKLDPDYQEMLWNYHRALRDDGRMDEARLLIDKALALRPNDPTFRWSVAMMQLQQGDYENGWQNHEMRWKGSPELRDAHHGLPTPQWQGESLKDKTLFVWGEQGFGDAMQFVRFVPLIVERARREGGRVEYCCFAQLHPLFARSLSGIVDHITRHDHRPLPEHDFHCPLMSLPLLLGTREATIQNAVPYLKADPAKVAQWKARFQDDPRLRVGLAWSGNPTHQRNPLRSVPIEQVAATFKDIPGAAFYSTQIGVAADVAKAKELGLDIVDLSQEMGPFADTADFMSSLDLMITTCTSMVHLAGGLGLPTWLLLDNNPHWVWLLNTERSIWYPTVKIFRQQAYRDWSALLPRLRQELVELVAWTSSRRA